LALAVDFVVSELLTAFTTVASGEHYFIDVLVAIPFALVVQKLAKLKALRGRHSVPAPAPAPV
jgi:hypothetical protein